MFALVYIRRYEQTLDLPASSSRASALPSAFLVVPVGRFVALAASS